MTVTVRFAPSPTGLLHVGNARMALMNVLFARAHDGRFCLRIDDTDRERSTPAFEEAIREDLRWLGWHWQAEARQSDRFADYEAATLALKEAGRLYPCYETPEELDYKRKRQRRLGRPPVYDRAALDLTDADRARLEAEGRRPHWRFRLLPQTESWEDLARGPVSVDCESVSDPVLIRADGSYLYSLPSVVDDLAMGITHVIRGEDHVTNTGTQVQMFQALVDAGCGGRVPAFAHLPLLVDTEGAGLSKRLGSLSLKSLREAEGLEPEALNAYLAALGTGQEVDPAPVEALVAGFDIGAYGRAAARFDVRQLARLNQRAVHALDFATVAPRLAALGCDQADAVFWEAVRGNLDRVADAALWHRVCFGTITPRVAIEDAAMVATAAAVLPEAPWDEGTWGRWTAAVKDMTGRKGRGLFRPLRRVLTGRDQGPEMDRLLPLIGRARAATRLAEARPDETAFENDTDNG